MVALVNSMLSKLVEINVVLVFGNSIVTGPAKFNHVGENYTVIFSPISSVLNVVSHFRKFQKKVH